MEGRSWGERMCVHVSQHVLVEDVDIDVAIAM